MQITAWTKIPTIFVGTNSSKNKRIFKNTRVPYEIIYNVVDMQTLPEINETREYADRMAAEKTNDAFHK